MTPGARSIEIARRDGKPWPPDGVPVAGDDDDGGVGAAADSNDNWWWCSSITMRRMVLSGTEDLPIWTPERR